MQLAVRAHPDGDKKAAHAIVLVVQRTCEPLGGKCTGTPPMITMRPWS